MKKSTLFAAAFFAAAAIVGTPQAKAQAIPSASTNLYDFSGWDGRNMLVLFADAADKGLKYPTKADFEAAGINIDLEFARSHTRYQPIIAQNAENNLVSDVYATRRIWMNLPTGAGKGIGGYPTGEFSSDVYTMWNFTHIFGSWNHGFMQAPGSWVDAAHKNGSYIYSGIEFFDYASGNQTAYSNWIASKNADGSYKYLDAVLNCLLFLGHDGINYNFEQGLPNEKLVAFHSALYRRAKEIGFENFHIGAYTNNSSMTAQNAYRMLGDNRKTVGELEGEDSSNTQILGQVHDAFLNYSGGNFYTNCTTSLNAAKTAMGTAENVYQGVWIVTMDRAWTAMNTSANKEMNMCLWGEHSESRFWQFNVGTSVMKAQENYQILQDRTTGGGNRNVLKRPAIASTGHNFQVMPTEQNKQMATFAGFASMAPERSAVKGNLPFSSLFSLGNGEIYFYKGKKTHGSWYNMSQQDYVPTYRWLLAQPGEMKTATTDTGLDVRFSHEEAYIGGSSVRISGKAVGTDVVIYKSELAVNGPVTAKVAVKNMAAGKNASNLSLILQKGDGTWISVPYGDTSDRAWEEKTLTVNGLSAGDVIKHIGVRIAGSSEDYKLYLGEIALFDGSAAKTPAPIDGDALIAEVKEETAKSLSVKLAWSVKDEGYDVEYRDRGYVFNDEVNIDHFEVFVKNGVDGKAVEVSRPAGWHAFIGTIDLEKYTEPYIGVRSVSTDLTTASEVEWIKIERYSDPSALPPVYADLYMPAYMDPTSNGMEAAYKNRWIEEVKTTGATGNIAYYRGEPAGEWDSENECPAEGNTNYVMAEDVLTVKQGETVQVTVRGHNGSDNIKYCMFKGFIDWDIDYEFNGENDELVWNFGTVNYGAGIQTGSDAWDRDLFVTQGRTFTLNVPADAKPGRTRFRIVACDAWFAGGLNATGAFNKGYALDIPVDVVSAGNTPREVAPGYKDYRDAGEADDPILASIDNVSVENGVATVSVVDGTAYFTNAEKAWFYDVNGRTAKFVGDATVPASVADLAAGVYVVKMKNGPVLRSAKVVVK